MWILFASGSAIFAGLTAILAKCGIRKTDSSVATLVRTMVVLLLAWGMAALSGSITGISTVSAKSWIFLMLSGLATGGSWLCYYRALQLGTIRQVTPVDKTSTILTILLACVLFHEPLHLLTWAGVLCIAIGTWLMIRPDSSAAQTKQKADSAAWFPWAVGSAGFAALTAILGKIGISGVNSTLGTAIRTCVVLLMAALVVLCSGKAKAIRKIHKQELGFLLLSGLATGGSWLCYYRALQDGPASVVVPIDKLSVGLTIVFSVVFLKETLSRRMLIGLLLLTGGTLCLAMA